MKITPVNRQDTALNQFWDEYIAAHNIPGHALSGWQEILEDIFQRTVIRLCAQDDNGTLTGFAFGYHGQEDQTLYSPRFGLHAKDQSTMVALCEAFTNYCHGHKITNTLLTTGNKDFSMPLSWNKANMLIPLASESEETLWADVPKKNRNMVRKAKKSSLEIHKGWDALDGFYEVYQKRFLDKSLSLKPQSFFEALPRLFGEKVQLLTIQKDGSTAGGMIFLRTGKAVTYLYNASNEQATRNGGNNALMWEAMRRYHATGAEFIELGESTIDGPVYNFKKRLSKNIDHISIFYSRLFEPATKASFMRRLQGKTRALEHKIMPHMPLFLRHKYLCKHGRQGRVI